MKRSNILKLLCLGVVLVLATMVIFTVWVLFFSVMVVPSALYAILVMPICRLCEFEFDYEKPMRWVADLLFDRFFDWLINVTEWLDGRYIK